MDRLARNLKDLLSIVEGLNDRGVTVHFHHENQIYRPESQDPFSKLMLSVIGACAAFQLSMITTAREEGVAVAKAQGKKFGQPAKLTENQIADIHKAKAAGVSVATLVKEYGVVKQTIYSALKA